MKATRNKETGFSIYPYRDEGAQFFPDTFFTVFPGKAFSTDGSHSEEAVRDYFAHPEKAWFQARIEHERQHWVQFVGSSFGLFIGLLHQRAGLFATLFWDNLTDTEISRICEERREGKTPFRFRSDGRSEMGSINPVSTACAELSWIVSTLANHLRWGHDALKSRPVSRLITIAMIAMREPLDLRTLVNLLGKEWEPTDPYEPTPVDLSLSAAAIEEALALVAQMSLVHRSTLLPLEDADTMRGNIFARATALMHGHLADESRLYVTALQMFSDLFPFENRSAGDPLAAFSVIADLALNPQLPPLSPYTSLADWDGLLPSRRFLSLLQALKEVGLPRAALVNLMAEELSAYRQRLLEVAGLSTWEPGEARAQLSTAIARIGDSVPRVCADPTRLLYRAAIQSAALREAVPCFFANPVEVWIGAKWSGVLKDETYDLAWRCPFISLEGRSIASGISQSEFDGVTFSNMVMRTLLEYATTTGTPDYAGFPTDARSSALRGQIPLWMAERFNGAFRE